MNIKAILERPIVSQDEALRRKQGYRSYPLCTTWAANDESLVDIAQYGIAGQSYYSRPNGATGQPVAQVESRIFLRKTVAERLAEINYALQNSNEVSGLFGGKRIELYVEEGLRSPAMQRYLYEEVFPRLIAGQHKNLSPEERKRWREHGIARPSTKQSPSPHVTGAALDLKLRYAHPDLKFIPHSFIPMGHSQAQIGLVTQPDYFEKRAVKSQTDLLARRNRRIFYWVMRGALQGKDTGFVVNPTEIWHWSYGDQLWAALAQAPCAVYGAARPDHAG